MTYEEYCERMKNLIFSRRRIAFHKLKELVDESDILKEGEHWVWPDTLIHITPNMFLVSYTAGYTADLRNRTI